MKSIDQKRTEATQRQRATNMLTPRERLQVLDSRLGVNVGATRERAKLTARIALTAGTARGAK